MKNKEAVWFGIAVFTSLLLVVVIFSMRVVLSMTEDLVNVVQTQKEEIEYWQFEADRYKMMSDEYYYLFIAEIEKGGFNNE